MSDVWDYINTIRNEQKRNYARAYLFWLQNGELGDPPTYGCSFMAAQAVRQHLGQFEIGAQLRDKREGRS